jgi:hypothetical protein
MPSVGPVYVHLPIERAIRFAMGEQTVEDRQWLHNRVVDANERAKAAEAKYEAVKR